MTNQLFWVAFFSILVALYAIRCYIEANAILNWYKTKFKSHPDFDSPPPPPRFLQLFNALLFLPKL